MVDYGFLNHFHANQNYTVSNKQVVGEAMLWENGELVVGLAHLERAPEHTVIQLREHYYGVALLTKKSNRWYVTNISVTATTN